MATAIALVGWDYHNFNSDLALTHIVSLHENGSRPHIIIKDTKGNQVGETLLIGLGNAFEDMMYVIVKNILKLSMEDLQKYDNAPLKQYSDLVPLVKSDIHINVMRLSPQSLLRVDRNVYKKYSGFSRLQIYGRLIRDK